MVRHRSQTRRRRVSDHERERHHGGANGGRSKEEGRLTLLLSPSCAGEMVSPGDYHALTRPILFATRPSTAGEDQVKLKGMPKCLRKMFDSQSMLAIECCTALTLSPTQCASRSVPKAATSCSTNPLARPASPRTGSPSPRRS